MPLAEKLYDWLASGPQPDCDRILAAGLERAEPPYFERIVESLLKRGYTNSWAGLIEQYPRLSPEVRQRLRSVPERLRAGIDQALRSSSPDSRANALTALGEEPIPKLAYLLADALRDPSNVVRQAGAAALRRTAEELLARNENDRVSDSAVDRKSAAADRALFVDALREGLRTYELHRKQEVLEVCLWFARDLRESLWEALSTPRSVCAGVVSARLREWDDSRLAHFLLEGLPRSDWRQPVQALLSSWVTREQISALLRESEVLGDARVRQYLVCLRRPRWFEQIDEDLSSLPSPLRIQAPRWVCHLGWSEEQKVARLWGWLGGRDSALQSAAAWALGSLDSPAALARLDELAAGTSPHATFARWCAAGRRSGLVRTAARPRLEWSESQPPSAFIAGETSIDAEFATLWQLCRRTPAERNESILSVMRDHVDGWGPRLAAYLRSPDARDRALVLEILSHGDLLRRFQAEWQPLLHDVDENVRADANRLLRSLSAATSPSAPAPAPQTASPETPAVLEPMLSTVPVAQVRRELRELLDRLLQETLDAKEVEGLIQQVRARLKQLRTWGSGGAVQ